MPTILAVSGSPSLPSFTHEVLALACAPLTARGLRVDTLALRELPARALLAADGGDPAVADAVARLEAADAVVLATPVYKAAYSGLLKTFLDLLPQHALAGKVVLPLATGGSMAHALALDYGLRPVLMSMAPAAVANAVFVHAESALRDPEGLRGLEPDTRTRLDQAAEGFADLLDALALHALLNEAVTDDLVTAERLAGLRQAA